MMNLGLLAVLGIVALIYLWLIYFILSSIFRSDARWGVSQSVGLVALVVLIAGPVSMVLLAIQTPEARSIDETMDITSESGDLHISAIRMAAPDYSVEAESFIEPMYESILVVTVENQSNAPVDLEFFYGESAGTVGGYYSPGSASNESTRTAPANWSGDLEFPVRHHRFVSGGSLSFTISTESETLVEKQYDMVIDK